MEIDEKTGLILSTLATPVKNVVVVDCNKLLELLYKNCQVIHNKSIDSP